MEQNDLHPQPSRTPPLLKNLARTARSSVVPPPEGRQKGWGYGSAVGGPGEAGRQPLPSPHPFWRAQTSPNPQLQNYQHLRAPEHFVTLLYGFVLFLFDCLLDTAPFTLGLSRSAQGGAARRAGRGVPAAFLPLGEQGIQTGHAQRATAVGFPR